MSKDKYARQMLRSIADRQKDVLEKLAPYGVVDLEHKGDLITLIYGDGYRWTKTLREYKYIALIDKIPRRPGALH